VTLRRLRLIARAVAQRTGGGQELEDLVEARFSTVPLAIRRKTVRVYVQNIQFLYKQRLHALFDGV
jgi:hypothetical protein